MEHAFTADILFPLCDSTHCLAGSVGRAIAAIRAGVLKHADAAVQPVLRSSPPSAGFFFGDPSSQVWSSLNFAIGQRRSTSRMRTSTSPSIAASLRLERPPLRVHGPTIQPLPRSAHLHAGDKAAAGLPPHAGNLINLLFGRHPHFWVLKGGMPRASDDSAQPSFPSWFHRQPQEFVPGPAQQFRFLGFDWDMVSGLTSINDVKRLNLLTRASKMALNASPRCWDLQLILGHLTSVLPAVPLIHLYSRYLQLNPDAVYWSESDSPLSSVIDGVSSGPTLDSLFGVSQLRIRDLASSSQGLRDGGFVGRVGHGLGHLFPGTNASGSLDLCCRCPSPYQCKGAHGPSHLPEALPSPL